MPQVIDIPIPDARSGEWAIETFTVSEHESAMTRIRACLHPEEYVPAGTYKRLVRGRVIVMSNTPMELNTNRPIMRAGTGRVLINGLGLGGGLRRRGHLWRRLSALLTDRERALLANVEQCSAWNARPARRRRPTWTPEKAAQLHAA